MGTPIEHNSGKPTYESPCVTRKATKEELEEIDRQLHEKNPFGIDTNVKAPFPIPRKPKKEEPKEPKLTRQEIYTRKWQEARRLALEGLTKHEVSEKMGIPVKTLEKYAKRNDFKYAHKPHAAKEKPPKVDSPTDGIKTQERANMEELKPIQKTAEALSQSIRAKETLIDKIVEPDGAVDLEKLMGKLEKEDVVNRPSDSYYEKSAMQPLEVSQVLLTKEQFAGALLFNVIKYQMRKNYKGQKESDEYKARQYAYWLYLVKQGKKIDPSKDIVPDDFEFKVV